MFCDIMRPMRKTKSVKVGNVRIGGGNPIAVQSMTSTDTRNVKATVEQARRLAKAGCEIIRISIPDMEAVKALKEIRKAIKVPLVADVHFDHRLAIESLPHVDKIRINPGTIGSRQKNLEIIKALKDHKKVVRLGFNIGSLETEVRKRFGLTADALVESARRWLSFYEDHGFTDIVVSLKASDIRTTVEACRKTASFTDHPFHLGVTEAGTLISSAVKSSIAFYILLKEGIGDTIRVSIAGDPLFEVKTAYEILKALNLRERGASVIACPTCSRSHIDVPRLSNELERRLAGSKEPLSISVMGCEVNGPGEAAMSDFGVVGTKNGAAIYKRGKVIKRVSAKEVIDTLLREMRIHNAGGSRG